MKNKRTIIIASIYTFIVGIMVVSTLFVVNGIKKYVNTEDNYDYTIDEVFDSDESVIVSKIEDTTIIKPYLSEDVKIGKYYYDYKSDSEKQENSIIYYNNIYIQNNGVDYVDKDTFDIVSILEGEVTSIEDNEVYGKVLTIKHNDSLVTTYSNIDNILVSVGYKVSQGEIIASSKLNSLYDTDNNMLHFEVYYKGDTLDPESLYTLKVSEIE